MKRTVQSPTYLSVFVGILFGCLVMPSSVLVAQEELRIDENTVKVVPNAWELMQIDSKASLRGLCVLDKDHVWASGSNGTIINTSDGGKTWTVRTIEGAEELDVRDIHAIDEGTLVAMTSGTPARIYRSTNGGISWKMCYESTDKRVFLDALSFWNDEDGVVMGDPIETAVYLLRTTDGGRTWKTYPTAPKTLDGEAGFAASGTNAIAVGSQKYFIGLGGAKENDSQKTSRILYSPDQGLKWFAAVAPFERTPSAGIFSICFADEKHGVAVGGDYQVADSRENNFAFTHDGGGTWKTPDKKRQPPSGFRSAVAVSRKGREVRFVTVGPNGTDVSLDMGQKWRRISNEGFHAIAFTADGLHGWASGADGRIGRWTNRFDKPVK